MVLVWRCSVVNVPFFCGQATELHLLWNCVVNTQLQNIYILQGSALACYGSRGALPHTPLLYDLFAGSYYEFHFSFWSFDSHIIAPLGK